MAEANYSVTPLSAIRKVIAARMSEAKRTIPHYRLVADIEIDALRAVRNQLREHCESSISLNTLLVKACATALMDVPDVNVRWADTEIHRCHSADISIVTAIEGGLATPIIRDADTKSVWEIARETRKLGARAARNELKLEEVFGGSFSISNLGMFGVRQFDAVINAPQCAILAIGSAGPRYLVSEEGAPRIANVLTATLSVDHRAVDGTTGAAFIEALRRRIEQPDHIDIADAA